MNESEQYNIITKLGGWERMIILSGVLLSVPLFTLLGTAVYAIIVDRPDAHMGVLLTIISILVLWAIVWGLLWIVSGFRNGEFDDLRGNAVSKLEELQRENEALKKQLSELKK